MILWSAPLAIILVGSVLAKPASHSGLEGGSPVANACRFGNVSLPGDVFSGHVGWECFRQTHKRSEMMPVFICVERHEDANYSVPCFKSDGRVFGFDLKNETNMREILRMFPSEELNYELIKCHLRLVSACEGNKDNCSRTSGKAVCGMIAHSKFHMAVLGISIIFCLPIAILFIYCSWVSGNPNVSCCRNLITSLLFRSFFTLLIETEVRSEIIKDETVENWAGCEALASFEAITLNVVTAFWLILALYLYEATKQDPKEDPKVNRATYFILGLAITLAIIWIIIMAAGDHPNCWQEGSPLQWINHSARLMFILMQLALISVVLRRLLTEHKSERDNNERTLRRMSFLTTVLSPIFLVHFSLTAGRPGSLTPDEPYLYAEYFFDGIQGAVVSLLYLFLGDVWWIVLEAMGFREPNNSLCIGETLPVGERPKKSSVVTNAQLPTESTVPASDVTYSSILTPERFEKTIKLYRRLNAAPAYENNVTRKNTDNSSIKSEYYDVDDISNVTEYWEVIDDDRKEPKPVPAAEDVTSLKPYESKYLVNHSDSSDSEVSVVEVKISNIVREKIAPAAPCMPTTCEPRDQEKCLRDGQRELNAIAEKELQRRGSTTGELFRSPSGNLLIAKEAPGLLTVTVKQSEEPPTVQDPAPKTLTREKSAPDFLSMPEPSETRDVQPESSPEMEEPPPRDRLPSIYDDIVNPPKVSRTDSWRNRYKKQNYGGPWSVYRDRVLAERKRKKSEGIGPSSQVDALVNPGYVVPQMEDRSLADSKFSRFKSEKLNEIDEPSVESTDSESWEPQRVHFTRPPT